jgi:hypothetical protein
VEGLHVRLQRQPAAHITGNARLGIAAEQFGLPAERQPEGKPRAHGDTLSAEFPPDVLPGDAVPEGVQHGKDDDTAGKIFPFGDGGTSSVWQVSMNPTFLWFRDCTHSAGLRQIAQAVKEFTSGSIPFENRDFERIVEFRRVPGRSGEGASNLQGGVLHEFTGSPVGVRNACRIERKIVLK